MECRSLVLLHQGEGVVAKTSNEPHAPRTRSKVEEGCPQAEYDFQHAAEGFDRDQNRLSKSPLSWSI